MTYLLQDELREFNPTPPEKWVGDVLKRLGNSDDWAVQFNGIDDMRRLVKSVPKLLAPSLRKVVAAIVELADSLRSQLAKNGLRSLGELFARFGKAMNVDIDLSMVVMMKRAADTNRFIAEEAEITLIQVCRSATESFLMKSLVTSFANRQPRVRQRAVWCLAMLAQRIVLSGSSPSMSPELAAAADATTKALGDANSGVRSLARVSAYVLIGIGGSAGVSTGAAGVRLADAMLTGVDASAFDAFDLQCVQRCLGHAPFAG